MIAFITFKSSLVPLFEGLWSSNSWEFELSGFSRNLPQIQLSSGRIQARTLPFLFSFFLSLRLKIWLTTTCDPRDCHGRWACEPTGGSNQFTNSVWHTASSEFGRSFWVSQSVNLRSVSHFLSLFSLCLTRALSLSLSDSSFLSLSILLSLVIVKRLLTGHHENRHVTAAHVDTFWSENRSQNAHGVRANTPHLYKVLPPLQRSRIDINFTRESSQLLVDLLPESGDKKLRVYHHCSFVVRVALVFWCVLQQGQKTIAQQWCFIEPCSTPTSCTLARILLLELLRSTRCLFLNLFVVCWRWSCSC